MDLLFDTSKSDENEDVVGNQNRNRNTSDPLSREELESLESFCSHPQVQNYRRSSRGRRNAIYIPNNNLRSGAAGVGPRSRTNNILEQQNRSSKGGS